MEEKVKENNTFNNTFNNICSNEANDLFEKLWALYPVKRGKGSVSKTQKSKIAKIGYEKMKRAIDRYIQEQKEKMHRYYVL